MQHIKTLLSAISSFLLLTQSVLAQNKPQR